jgi:delta14-sterol reductase
MTKLNPKTTEPDFGGVWGALAISIGLPLLANVLYFTCNDSGCPSTWTSVEPYLNQLKEKPLISWEAAQAYFGWFFGLVILDRIVPGKVVQGTELRDGTKLTYKFNGTTIVVILTSILVGRGYQNNWRLPELDFLYDHLLELCNVTILSALGLAVYVYVVSFLHSREPVLAQGGNTGNPIFDWYIGRELNPRIGSFDIKTFCEMRPGLLLWCILNLAMLHHQYWKFGQVTDSMLLVCFFQIYYVVEGTFYESGILSMIDITTDGFGFMLAFGDLTFVPFTYTMQARYLADHPLQLGYLGVAGVLAVYLVGLTIFRLSNNEKNAFRRGHPSAKHLKYITAKTGTKLIVSGWWGTARHINYLGDWIMAWAMCLPTGFNTPITYYFVLSFGSLLLHRETRDEAKCSAKYQETWVEYKKRVPYRIIPWVY